MESQTTYEFRHYGRFEGSGTHLGTRGTNQPQGFGNSHDIVPPRGGTSTCFGFGGFLVLCDTKGLSRILNINRVLRKMVSTPDLHSSIRREAKTRAGQSQLSQEEKSKINTFLNFEKGRGDTPQGPRGYLRSFRKNCLFELLLLSTSRDYIVSSPSDYDTVFAGIRSFPELGVWRCCCEANGKPTEFVSGRSLLGLFCGTLGVSRTLEMYRKGETGPGISLKLEISWSDRFALSGFCGERELSNCYIDYVKSSHQKLKEDNVHSGLECKCFEGILEAIYLSIAHKAEHFEINSKVLELWPHYVYSVISSLGPSHMGSRSLVTSISNGLLSDIRERKSKLTHNEKVFGWQFCSLILGEYREIPVGLNPSILETYITCMDIVALFLYMANKGGSGISLREDSVLSRYLSSLYFTELGCFERSEFYIECISPYLSKGANVPRSNISRECEFLKIRIQERNFNLIRSISMSNTRDPEFSAESHSTENQVSASLKNSSWIVGWISDNIKKAIGTEEERWPGVENTFYFDKEINQWCQKGPDGRRITNEPPKTDKSDSLGNGNEVNVGSQLTQPPPLPPPPPPPPPTSQRTASNAVGPGTSGGIRSRYVDIFQSKK
ncbi:uncharacterized protein cubi_03095 [Cryptosporidium ubiquitum]|uniref:Uncharacterized protein n=1 Tax=Cryptosporidium ubiquitum TaxID=857276 RepID=A0A1J4ML69_9CRYT|nr:uncharacterized protein cubi_03095 [Cryptosporidium ubiquitum]OII74985.1 hypothetical protein cubi_03095 [Cryptosporidium ubiquitum]